MTKEFVVVVPAAGVGKRMLSQCPKQYLTINGITILEHTVLRLLSHPYINEVIIALGEFDEYFQQTQLVNNPNVTTVIGGSERVDSVYAGLCAVNNSKYPWVLVHDAARPCVTIDDISTLIQQCINQNCGGLLAYPVRDTMKRSDAQGNVKVTESRDNLWHALTPQLYKTDELTNAIKQGVHNSAMGNGECITDESSAIELAGLNSTLVQGSSDNIKITRPDDLAFAEFILGKQHNSLT